MGNSTVSDARNITLVMDFYELTMSYDYFKQGKKDEIAYFDMFYRKNPDNGGYVFFSFHYYIFFLYFADTKI